MQTGDYKYLRWLASDPLIYREEIFWDQIKLWQQRASLNKYKDPKTAKWKVYKDPQAAKCLEAVELGFKECIKPLKLKGRPRSGVMDYSEKHVRLEKELKNVGLGNSYLQQLRNLHTDKSKKREEFQQKLNKRINLLTEFSKRKKIELRQAEIKKLVWATTSEIAWELIAKSEHVSSITLKRRQAEGSPTIYKTITVSGLKIPLQNEKIEKKRTPRKLQTAHKKNRNK